MDYIKKIDIDFDPQGDSVTIAVKQFDSNSRSLLIQPCYEGNKIDVREYTAALYVARPDGEVFKSDCSITEDGDILVSLLAEMMMLEGICRCDIKLYENDSLVSGVIFYINIVKSVMPGNSIKVWKSRSYQASLRIRSGSDDYQLARGEKLIFGVKKHSEDSQCLILKDIDNTDFDEATCEYRIKLTSEDTDIELGDYLYDIALRQSDGELVPVVGESKFTVRSTVVGRKDVDHD